MERQYKDSGIEWIGRIPKEWNVDIAKRVFKQRREKGNDVECQLLAATQKNGMYPQHLLEGVVKVAADTDLNLFKTVHKNDYVISLRSFQGGFEMSDFEGVCSPAYQVFYAICQTASQYYKYLFKSDAFIQEINSLTVGIREGKNILYDDFALLPIPIPPYSEQQQIADYLDKKCAEIDGLIDLQEQMIAQLTDYKQSVITETVTKGLNPNVELVPSGIDWIGEIPKGWRVGKVSYFFSVRLGKMLQPNSSSEEDTFENYYCAANVGQNNIKYEPLKQMWFSPIEKKQYEVKVGDLLVVEGGDVASCDIIKKDMGNVYFQNALHRVRSRHLDDVRILRYLLMTAKKIGHIDLICNKATISHFTKEKFESIRIPLPPIEEQQAIASYLDEKCSEIDSLIALKQQKIEALKEYKKSIIYEAVTGKTVID